MKYTSNAMLLEVLERLEGKVDSIMALASNFLKPRADDPRVPKPIDQPRNPPIPNMPSISPNMGGIDLPIETPFDFGYRGGETSNPEFHASKPGDPQKLWHRTGAVHEIPFTVPQGKTAEITVHPTPVMGIAKDRGTSEVMVRIGGELVIRFLDMAPRFEAGAGSHVLRITDLNIEGGFVWQCWIK
jgi:hypothetical protein